MKRDAIDFEKDPVKEVFVRMLFPTMLGMVSLVILNITDGAFVGRGAGPLALAAVNIIAPVFMFISGLGLMFGIGGSVAAGIHLAKGDTKAANIHMTQAILGSFLLSAILGAIMLCFKEETCRLFGASDLLLPEACTYLKWIAAFEPLCALEIVCMFFVRLDGSPKFASATSVVMSAANIILDYIFIFPLHMGLEGAAIATSICYGASGLTSFIYLAFFGKKLHLYRLKASWKSLKLTLRNWGYQIKIGISGLIGELGMAIMIVVGNYQFIRLLGEDGVAAFSVACYCSPIIFMMGNSIVQSVQPIISYAHGACLPHRIRESRSTAIQTAIISSLVISLIMWMGAPKITSIFLEAGTPAWEMCKFGLPLFGSSVVFVLINLIMVGYYQAIEKAFHANMVTLLRSLIVLVPAFLLMPLLCSALGLDSLLTSRAASVTHTGAELGLWLALTVTEAITSLFALLSLRRTRL